MAAVPGGTGTVQVLDGGGTPRLFSSVTDAGNPTAAANMAVQIRPPEWTITNTSAANAQATVSKAASAAGVKHVCTGFIAQLYGDATGNADAGTVNIRDGATGAGTVLWTGRCGLASGASAVGPQISMAGLNIVGTAATAMTIEFSANGAAHTLQTVSLSGYDIS